MMHEDSCGRQTATAVATSPKYVEIRGTGIE